MNPLRLLVCAFFLAGPLLHAADHGITVREGVIYSSPNNSSSKLAQIERGREVAILEKTPGWLHVLASLTQQRDVTGWMFDKGVVTAQTPNGDKIMFGEAARSELEATRRGGRRGAADDARRLYARTNEYFPMSALAGEALYRAADIQWQVEADDIRTRPSSRAMDPGLHVQIEEQWMKQVMKKFPNTKWADLAAYHLIDNKLCGDWEGLSKCPEKESEIYEKYAVEHPNSPAAAEALYNAAWRKAALIEIYKTENNSKGSEQAKNSVKTLSQQVISKYSQTDWAYRSQALGFMVDQGVSTYGSGVE